MNFAFAQTWINEFCSEIGIPWLTSYIISFGGFLGGLLVALLARRALWLLKVIRRDPALLALARPADIWILWVNVLGPLQELPEFLQSSWNPHLLFFIKTGFHVWFLSRLITALARAQVWPQSITEEQRAVSARILLIAIAMFVAHATLERFGAFNPLVSQIAWGLFFSVAILGQWRTLRDIFCGITLSLDGSIREGDVLEWDKIKGTVEKIEWRTTRVQTASQTVLVPNSNLAKSILGISHKSRTKRSAEAA